MKSDHTYSHRLHLLNAHYFHILYGIFFWYYLKCSLSWQYAYGCGAIYWSMESLLVVITTKNDSHCPNNYLWPTGPQLRDGSWRPSIPLCCNFGWLDIMPFCGNQFGCFSKGWRQHCYITQILDSWTYSQCDFCSLLQGKLLLYSL